MGFPAFPVEEATVRFNEPVYLMAIREAFEFWSLGHRLPRV